MKSKLYTIISNKLRDLSLVNARDFEQCKHMEIIVLDIC